MEAHTEEQIQTRQGEAGTPTNDDHNSELRIAETEHLPATAETDDSTTAGHDDAEREEGNGVARSDTMKTVIFLRGYQYTQARISGVKSTYRCSIYRWAKCKALVEFQKLHRMFA